jgi:tetratricopeptide (TPR) repeat protein
MGQKADAAQAMEDAGLPAAAAIYREKAHDAKGARALWSRLASVMPSRGASDAYVAALVQFNLGRCALACGDARQAREAFVGAVRLLEEAADEFESGGVRERAFDCFQVLVEIGRVGKQFEHVLEGYINCVRILREDHLKYYALQYYEEATAAAKEAGEFSAAATIAREASDNARSLGMNGASAHYALDQAQQWCAAARQHTQQGSPPEIAENSLLAAVLAFGQLGQFARAGALYRDLAAMDLEPSRKAHYERASRRYVGVKDESLDATPLGSQLRQDSRVIEVWHADVAEWEQRGSAVEACAEVVLDGRWPDPIRRRAMLARLRALVVEATEGASADAIGGRVKLAEELAQVPLYAVLSPLERLFARPERQVKMAVLAALRALFFKRSLATITAATRDPDPGVADEAGRSLREMVFPHAFDPLARVVRESANMHARFAALQALAKIETPAAAEFLVGVLEHGSPADRSAARKALHDSASRAFMDVARAAYPTATGELRSALHEVLAVRGG